MRCLPALALVLPVALLGCGKPPTDHPAHPAARASTPNTIAASPVSPTPTPPAKTSSNVKDCFDGDCLLALSKPVRIPLDAKRFYYRKMSIVAVTTDRVSYRVDYPQGGHAEQWLAEGGSSSFAFRSHTPVDVRLMSIRNGKAVLAISPGTPQ